MPHDALISSQASEQTSVDVLEMCSDHPTILAFTGVNWCPHCVDAQPKLNTLKTEAAQTKTFHVQQFDWVLPPMKQSREEKRAEHIIQQFSVRSFPTFLVYDHIQKFFVRIRDLDAIASVLQNEEALEGLRKSTKPEQYWPSVPKNIRIVECDKSEMIGHVPDMVLMQENTVLLPLQEEVETPRIVLCAHCPTIIAFSGKSWCDPCMAMEPEMKLLHSQQGCGKYHVHQYDYNLNVRDTNMVISEGFNIERWPTYLIFDPSNRIFYHYLGQRKAHEMMHCNTRSLSIWRAPQGITIELVSRRRPPVQAEMIASRVQTNGKLNLCAQCPTILVFALCAKSFSQLQESDAMENTHGMHVLQFTNANKDTVVFELFGIQKFPTALIYNPKFNLFFQYTGTVASLQAIKTQYQQSSSLKTWNIHPRVVLLR